MKAIGMLGSLAVLLGAMWVGAAEIKPDTILRIEKAVPEAAAVKPEKARKVLVYTHAEGFVHGSIPLGAKAIEILGKKTGAYEVTKISDDPAVFDSDLSEYDAIVLMSTTGKFLLPRKPDSLNVNKEQMAKKTDEEKKKIEEGVKEFEAAMKAYKEAEAPRRKALLNFVTSGKGLVGIHAATDAYYGNGGKDWPEYPEMIGGSFNSHNWGKISVKIDDPSSPLNTQFEGKNFTFSDEIYQYREVATHSREKMHVLQSVDLEASGFPKEKAKDGTEMYKGETRKDHDYAVSWIKKYGNGRVFYTLFGHNDGTYMNPLTMKFFLAGMQYALGDLKADDSPSKK